MVFGTTKRETSETPVFPNQFQTVLFLVYFYAEADCKAVLCTAAQPFSVVLKPLGTAEAVRKFVQWFVVV